MKKIIYLFGMLLIISNFIYGEKSTIFFDGFEGGSVNWQLTSNGSGGWMVWDATYGQEFVYEGTKSLTAYSSAVMNTQHYAKMKNEFTTGYNSYFLFSLLYDIETGQTATAPLKLLASIDNGSTWQQLWQTTSSTNGKFKNYIFELKQFNLNNKNVKFAFLLDGSGATTVFIDNIQILQADSYDYTIEPYDFNWVNSTPGMTVTQYSKLNLSPFYNPVFLPAVDEGYVFHKFNNFVFPFFGYACDSLYLTTNGYFTFSANISELSTNITGTSYYYSNYFYPIPTEGFGLNNFIAALFKDLKMDENDAQAGIYVYEDNVNDRAIIEYRGFKNKNTTNSSKFYTFQIVLKGNGEIIFQYKDIKDDYNDALIGIENITGSSGVQLFYGQAPKPKEGFAIKLVPQFDIYNISLDSGSNLVFNNAVLGNFETRNITITNTGIKNWIGNLSIVNDTSANFSIVGSSQLNIPVGASAIVNIKFTPSDYSYKTAQLKIVGQDTTITINLKSGKIGFSAGAHKLNIVGGTAQTSYKMIGIPGEFSNSTVNNILFDMGDYDIKHWRLFKYSGTSFVEYNSGNFSIEKGKGYFIISRENKTVNIPAGTTVDLTNNYTEITLSRGWNIISNPYHYPILWSNILNYNSNISQAISQRLYIYNAGYTQTDTLKPFLGYFINNTSNNELTLKIPNIYNSKSNNNLRSIWNIAINVSNGEENCNLLNYDICSIIPDNYIKDEFPPFISNSLKVTNYDNFINDIQLYNSSGNKFIFKISNFEKNDIIKIDFKGYNIPRGFKKLLIDKYDNSKILIDENNSYSFVASNENEREFELLVGNEEFLKGNSDFISGTKNNISIYPNPFNPVTNIKISVEKDNSKVLCIIYDVNGRMVNKLFDKIVNAGEYKVIWNGKDYKNQDLSSGIYFVKYSINGNIISNNKILLIK